MKTLNRYDKIAENVSFSLNRNYRHPHRLIDAVGPSADETAAGGFGGAVWLRKIPARRHPLSGVASFDFSVQRSILRVFLNALDGAGEALGPRTGAGGVAAGDGRAPPAARPPGAGAALSGAGRPQVLALGPLRATEAAG